MDTDSLSQTDFDFAIIGAGSAGLTAADFAARLGLRVALIERDRIGGDCTWTGCVPSKALVKAARVAHQVRHAHRFGVMVDPPRVDMAAVRDRIRDAVEQVYRRETPEVLATRGISVVKGAARFTGPTSLDVDGRTIRARKILIATGARPARPAIDGLDRVPYATYETIFDNDRLPDHLLVVGGGPIGAEMAQAYRRLGARVTLVGPRLLPREDDETRAEIQAVFEREGVDCHLGRATALRRDGDEIVAATDHGEDLRGDLLLVATGRRPNLEGLDLAAAGITHDDNGVPVDRRMRTNVSTVYAAGDVVGGPQFTHFAGWQGFQAARAALLPGGGADVNAVPRLTFTDPEIAHIGPDLDAVRDEHGDRIEIRRIDLADIDRAVADGETRGFVRLAVRPNGTLLAATVVSPHAGETLGELVLAIGNGIRAQRLAETMHAYPTYATGLQQIAVGLALDRSLSGFGGAMARLLAGGARPRGTGGAATNTATTNGTA